MITKDEKYLRRKTRLFIRRKYPNASRLKWGDNKDVTGYWYFVPEQGMMFTPCKL
ncbi:MAG: hypothetical protein JXQ90_01535 [Cyclobacteriaceae bacterium]